jgi:predicted phage terminase large subunit-like protein
LGEIDVYQLAFSNFRAYCKMIRPDYKMAKHLAELADVLQAMESKSPLPLFDNQVCSKLIYNAPPRHGKSVMISELFVTWFLGRNPEKEVISVAYSAELAEKWGRNVRNIIDSPVFKKVFPRCVLSDDSKAKHNFSTTSGGKYIAIGIDGSATGNGAHLLIVDDPYKNRKEAESKTTRDSIEEGFSSSLSTRLSPEYSMTLLTHTRWVENDISGTIIAKEEEAKREASEKGVPFKPNWLIITKKAVNEDGTTLWPSRFNKEYFDNLDISNKDFLALYQGEPVSDSGNLIRREWIQYWTTLPKFNELTLSADLAFRKTNSSDFVVLQVWGRNGFNHYLVKEIHARLSFTETLTHVRSLLQQFPQISTKLIEGKANGDALIDTLKRQTGGVVTIEPKGDKESRLNATLHLWEGLNVFLPEHYRGTEELLSFPRAKNDDRVDAASQYLNWAKTRAGKILTQDEIFAHPKYNNGINPLNHENGWYR